MFVPDSYGLISITEGRGMKMSLTFPVSYLEDSDDAMHRYLSLAKKEGDFLGLLRSDEESLPCIHRHWKLPEFENEILETCANAWLRLGETITEVLQWSGAEVPALSLVAATQAKTYKSRCIHEIL